MAWFQKYEVAAIVHPIYKTSIVRSRVGPIVVSEHAVLHFLHHLSVNS